MDLWDVAKVVWRRKLIAIPLLLITIGLAAAIPYMVRPDYQTTGHITLLPPSATRPENSPNKIVSPWNVYSLADAITIHVARADVRESFIKEGFSGEWTASIGGTQLPVIELEVIAPSADQSRRTLLHLIEVIKSQLASMQANFATTGAEAITANVLDSGQNVEVITSAVKRTMIVVIAIGVIITISVSLWLDAMTRRRTRRAVVGGGEIDMYRGPLPGGSPIVMPQRSTPPAPTHPGGMVPTAPSFIPSSTAAPAPAHAASVHVPDIKVITIDYRPNAADATTTTPSEEDNTHPLSVVRPDGTLPVPSDATIVLPLTARRWTDVDAGGGPNGSGANGR